MRGCPQAPVTRRRPGYWQCRVSPAASAFDLSTEIIQCGTATTYACVGGMATVPLIVGRSELVAALSVAAVLGVLRRWQQRRRDNAWKVCLLLRHAEVRASPGCAAAAPRHRVLDGG